MLKLGLLGRDISHSQSKYVYEQIIGAEVDYRHFDCQLSSEVPSLKEIFSEVEGLSITTPYKEHFLRDVEMEERVSRLGAINCIKNCDGGYRATNTDYCAILDLLPELCKIYENPFIVILGSGVMAKVTVEVCSELNFGHKVFSRSGFGDLTSFDFREHLVESHDYVYINACSRKFEYKGQLKDPVLFWDYNYQFEPHQRYFKAQGIPYLDGMNLLLEQARHALMFWELST